MKPILWAASIIFLGSASPVLAEEVNFGKANPVLQALVDATIAGDDLVDFTQAKFDESFSSFKTERLKYDLQGSLKDTPWLSGGRADLTAGSSFVADRDPNHTGVAVKISSTVKTNVLALLRYSGIVSLEKSGTGDENAKFHARAIAHLRRLSVATSLDDIYTVLRSSQVLVDDVIQDEIDRHVDRKKCVEAGTCESWGETPESIQRSINISARIKANYRAIRIEALRSAGKVRKITITSDDGRGLASADPADQFELTPGKIMLTITDDAMSASMDAFAERSADRLNTLKADWQSRLVGIQNGRSVDKDWVQDGFRRVLIDFKQIVRGEHRY